MSLHRQDRLCWAGRQHCIQSYDFKEQAAGTGETSTQTSSCQWEKPSSARQDRLSATALLRFSAFRGTRRTSCLQDSRAPGSHHLPCSNLFICWIWSTVFFRILHLSGLTLRVSMSPMFADSSSASSSKYLFSCSRRRFSLL